MENVLVTGAGGFIGSHLCEQLVYAGYNVTAFVRYNSKNNLGWLEKSQYKDKITFYSGDIRDYDSVKAAMDGKDIVFNLAALIGIPYSYVSPLAYIKTNVEGTYNVLQAARELKTKRIVQTSTSEIYGTAQFVPITEQHPINPQSPYAASKASSDLLALTYYRSFDIPVAIVRPFNTFGPRQSARAIIPTLISQALTSNIIKIGSTSPTRDLTFVKSTVDGFIKAANSQKAIGEVINLGSNFEISIGELAKRIIELTGSKAKLICDNERIRPGKSEVERLWADAKKANELLNWKPLTTFDEGLKETIKWISSNLDSYKPQIYNV